MVESKELSVGDYIKTLKYISDFTEIEVGQTMFNRNSLSIEYVDTFIKYYGDRDVVEYKNCKGEIWLGAGKGYWYFLS